jgi:hypothetical protein
MTVEPAFHGPLTPGSARSNGRISWRSAFIITSVNVDEEQALGDRHDPVEPRLRDAPVLAEALDQAAAGRPHHANARTRIDEDDRNGGKDDPGGRDDHGNFTDA